MSICMVKPILSMHFNYSKKKRIGEALLISMKKNINQFPLGLWICFRYYGWLLSCIFENCIAIKHVRERTAWLYLANCEPKGSEDNQECIFFTLNTHQATFISILYDMIPEIWAILWLMQTDTDLDSVRTDRHEGCNIYVIEFFNNIN